MGQICFTTCCWSSSYALVLLRNIHLLIPHITWFNVSLIISSLQCQWYYSFRLG